MLDSEFSDNLPVFHNCHYNAGSVFNPIALRPKLYTILAFLSAIGLNKPYNHADVITSQIKQL